MTASRFLDGLDQSRQAIEQIDNGEYQKAMATLRQSYRNCQKVLFYRPDKIRSALNKCNPKHADTMLINGLIPENRVLNNRINYFKESIQVHPKDVDFYQTLSLLYGFASEFEKGLETINTAIKLDSSQPNWIYTKASFLQRLLSSHGQQNELIKINEAFDCYQEYLNKNPIDDQKVPEAYYAMAYLFLLKNDMEKCRCYWEKANVANETRLPCFDSVENDFSPKRVVSLIMNSDNRCLNCGKQNPKFKCSCLLAKYCSRPCQLAHWSIHKFICSAKTNKK